MNLSTFLAFFCVFKVTMAQNPPSIDELKILAKYTEDIGMPQPSRHKRDAGEPGDESPVKVGVIGGSLLNGITAVATNLPQFTKDGRHYWPSAFSLTHQIGLQGVNGLVDDVVSYERTRALAVARDASCSQRMNCWLTQNFILVRNMFGPSSEEQRLTQNIDCDKVFAGCQHYR